MRDPCDASVVARKVCAVVARPAEHPPRAQSRTRICLAATNPTFPTPHAVFGYQQLEGRNDRLAGALGHLLSLHLGHPLTHLTPSVIFGHVRIVGQRPSNLHVQIDRLAFEIDSPSAPTGRDVVHPFRPRPS
jgi:hypothetical protein